MANDLSTPERVNYFFGQVLGEDDFTAEQTYLAGRDRRLQRYLHGWGVVCGLGVSGASDGTVTVEPGLAVDSLGREIVVPEPRTADPAVLTDESGVPSGATPSGDAVTICVVYAEALTRPVPVPDEVTGSRFTRTTETYSLVVRDGFPPARPGVLSKEERDLVLSGSGSPAQRLAEASESASSCGADDERCVVIATVRFEPQGISIDPWTYRKQLYRVEILQELLFRLARRVFELESR
jgi:hypothetical protein